MNFISGIINLDNDKESIYLELSNNPLSVVMYEDIS